MKAKDVKNYSLVLDVIKAISIVAVVFYHIGWLQTGYLGVDAFLVINGFLIIPPLVKQMGGGKFMYINWLRNRILRLWPLLLIGGAVCLCVGFVGMLPDDYENLSQSVIASNFFSNNILSAITTRNYWDVGNAYKPLMHTWYVGILVEFYVAIPILLMLVKWACKLCGRVFERTSVVVMLFILVASLTFYLLPVVSESAKFYYLHCRLYEFLAGGLVGMFLNERPRTNNRVVGISATIALIVVFCCSLFLTKTDGDISAVTGQLSSTLMVSRRVLLLLTVVLSCVACRYNEWNNKGVLMKRIAVMGKMSFSIFVWHQIFLAFYRYYFSSEMGMAFVVGLWGATLLLSWLTYRLIEQRIKPNWRTFRWCCIVVVVLTIPSAYIYVNAGVVRDVPECGVYKGTSHRGMFAEYCDRVYAYNNDFPKDKNGKINVLVEGISFGRDFANVLLESEWSDKINLSYIYQHNAKYKARYATADYIFSFCSRDALPDYVKNAGSAVLIGIGTKNYGECNGVVYRHRRAVNYLQSTVAINPSFYCLNEQWRQSWGEKYYVDLIAYSTAADGKIRVFSDEGQFISQDCRHLTQAGAAFLAHQIDFEWIFGSFPNDD